MASGWGVGNRLAGSQSVVARPAFSCTRCQWTPCGARRAISSARERRCLRERQKPARAQAGAYGSTPYFHDQGYSSSFTGTRTPGAEPASAVWDGAGKLFGALVEGGAGLMVALSPRGANRERARRAVSAGLCLVSLALVYNILPLLLAVGALLLMVYTATQVYSWSPPRRFDSHVQSAEHIWSPDPRLGQRPYMPPPPPPPSPPGGSHQQVHGTRASWRVQNQGDVIDVSFNTK